MRDLQRTRWEALAAHLKKWFFEPDLQALAVVLSVSFCHDFTSKTEKPVWLFVIGASGSAKTAIIPPMLQAGFENVTIAGDVSDKTFLSGFQPHGRDSHDQKKGKQKQASKTSKTKSGKKRDYSMLGRMGETAILCFKDFTTFCAKDPKERAAIASQLREIWDGNIHKDVGSQDTQMEWQGKLTVIACATHDLEKMWAIYRSLGDRFLTVEWRHGDDIQSSTAAVDQMDHAEEINEGTKRLTKEFLSLGRSRRAKMPDTKATGIVYLAALVAWARTQVERGRGSEITDVKEKELPTRLNMALARIAQAHATLFFREVEDEDVAAARRVGMDTIPSKRRKMLELLPEPPDEISLSDIIDLTGEHPNLIKSTMEELEALKIVKGEKTDTGYYWRVTDEFHALRVRAGLAVAKVPAAQ